MTNKQSGNLKSNREEHPTTVEDHWATSFNLNSDAMRDWLRCPRMPSVVDAAKDDGHPVYQQWIALPRSIHHFTSPP